MHKEITPERATDKELARLEQFYGGVIGSIAAELRALRARVEPSDYAFDYMMRTLAEGVIETGETPEIHADKLAQQAAALLHHLAALRAPVDVEGEVERIAREMFDAFAEVFCVATIADSKDVARAAVRPLVERAARLSRIVDKQARDYSAMRRQVFEALAGILEGAGKPLAADLTGLLAGVARLAREAEGLRGQIATVIHAAHEAGWNGVENSKILAVFVQNMGAELAAARAEIEATRSVAATEIEALREQRSITLQAYEAASADLAAARAEIERLKVEEKRLREWNERARGALSSLPFSLSDVGLGDE